MILKIEIEINTKPKLGLSNNWFYDDDFGKMAKHMYVDIAFFRFILRFPYNKLFKKEECK